MYGVTEIRKQNAERDHNKRFASQATWAKLRHGGILLRYGLASHTLDSKDDIERFHKEVAGKNVKQQHDIIEKIFKARSAGLDSFRLID